MMYYYYIVSVLFLLLVWCPGMAFNASVQHNGGLLPGIILLTQSMLLPSGNPFKSHKIFCIYLQPMVPPKRFDIFPPDWGMLRRSRCVQIFLEISLTRQCRVLRDIFFFFFLRTPDCVLFQEKSERI